MGTGKGDSKRIPPKQVNGGTFNVEVPPARRTGTGVVPGAHNANIRVLNSDGSTRNVWREVSGNATESEKALGTGLMRQGKGPRTKAEHGYENIEAHHRGQRSMENGGVMDDLTEYVHRRGGNHTRHQLPSELTPAQRAREIREYYKKRGSEYILPGEGI